MTVEQLVRRICVAVHRHHAHRPRPRTWWVSVATIMDAIGHDHPHTFDQGIVRAM
jgi:hypothetical protein